MGDNKIDLTTACLSIVKPVERFSSTSGPTPFIRGVQCRRSENRSVRVCASTSSHTAEQGPLPSTGDNDIVLKIRLLNSFTPKALLVTVAAGAVFLIGGVANADTPQDPQDSGSSTGGLPLTGAGGLDLGHLVGPVLQPILGGPAGGTGGLGLGQLSGPILGGLGS